MKHKQKGVDQIATEKFMLQAHIVSLIEYEELLVDLCEQYFEKAEQLQMQIAEYKSRLESLSEGGVNL